MKINTYIRQPYPYYYEDLKRVFLLLCLLAFISLLFTYLFEPFTVNDTEHRIDSIWILVLHAIIPIPIAMAYLFFLNKLVFDIDKWTLGKEFFHLALILLLIGFANFFIRDFIYTNPDNWSWRYLWEEIRNTFLVGSLLLVIVLPLNLERLWYRHLKFLEKLPNHPAIEKNKGIVNIATPIPSEQFKLHMKRFLFAKVDGNYLEIFRSSSEGFEKDLKRMTLKEFIDQVSAFPFILKVHRSYVVNLQVIKSISGNATGYQLHLNDYYEGTVPVSRSNIQAFNKFYATWNS